MKPASAISNRHMLDKKFVHKKLEEIRTYLGEIEPILKLPGKEFFKGYRNMRTAERDFQLIVDAAVDINNHILLALGLPPADKNYQSFTALGKAKVLSEKKVNVLAPSTGLRNKLVHEYDEINPAILHRSLKRFAPLYREYGSSILKYLKANA